MMPWMVTHKDLKPHTNLLPTLVVPTHERASRTISISFDFIHYKMERKTLLHHIITKVILQNLETLDVLLNHRMHVNTRLQLRPEVRAACARALWNPFPSVCFCLLITWHHKPSKTERDNQRLVQILVVRTQYTPQLDGVDVMLLNATYDKNTPELKKRGRRRCIVYLRSQ